MTTEDRVRDGLGRNLFRMTWPMLFGVVSLLGFHLVDSAFIGQLGVEPLAALAFTLPLQQFITGAQVGLGIATTALVSRAIGEGDPQRARRLGGLVVVTGSTLILILCILICLVRPARVTAAPVCVLPARTLDRRATGRHDGSPCRGSGGEYRGRQPGLVTVSARHGIAGT